MIEKIILSGLFTDVNYARRVLPYVEPAYFADRTDRSIYIELQKYFAKYNDCPTKAQIIHQLSESDLSQELFSTASQTIEQLDAEPYKEIEWAVEQTEKFCQDRALYNAILKSIQVMEGKDKTLSKGSIPTMLQEALGISFDTSVGHDYLEDAEVRFEFYHRRYNRIPFDLDMMNKITQGGLMPKTLNVVLAGTNVGKTIWLCHNAAANLNDGKNVLYITLEMAEEEIAKRIDANLLNVPINELLTLPQESYFKKVERLRQKSHGKLIVKEYPTASAHVGHFRHLLNELKMKKKFVPDIIYIDYLNICASQRLKNGAVGMYQYVKAIAEEIRGLAQEYELPIHTASQLNRGGHASSDPDITDTSESFGLPQTADLLYGMIGGDEADELGVRYIKQMKSRYDDVGRNRRFAVGLDKQHMRFYDVDHDPSTGEVYQDKPVMDSTTVGETINNFESMEDFKQRFKKFK